MTTLGIDWSKHAKKKSKPVIDRRLSLPVTKELQKVIEFFRSRNPELEFSDTAILMTFIEAGVKTYAMELSKKQQSSTQEKDVEQDEDTE